MTDMLRVRMWAMGLAMEHTPEDADREATEIVAQWLVDWVTERGAAHEPELPVSPTASAIRGLYGQARNRYAIDEVEF